MRMIFWIGKMIKISLLAKDNSFKTSHQYYFQVQLQMFAYAFPSVDFLLYSPKNNGDVLLTTVKKNRDFIEKMNTKSWQYFKNAFYYQN